MTAFNTGAGDGNRVALNVLAILVGFPRDGIEPPEHDPYVETSGATLA